ncbi:MAG: DUF4388 domain-containing protein [Thermoanaerobaculales bacterium]|jgi:hypothetical protein|nr:DUF4388 domain-containing protein [Thermoanaerobaculales bacterium]
MLRGSLTDLAIVDLIQIPLGSRKTGELLIATEEQDARLYYVDGTLVHLVSGDVEGVRVLDLIIGWHDGEFEFRADVLTDRTTFEGDIVPKLLAAVDHLNEAREVEKAAGDAADRVRRLLRDFLAENDFAIHACLMHGNGTMDVCGAERVETPAWLEKIRTTVLEVVETYPRRQLNRMLFEDQEGTLVVTCYPEDQSALLVAAKQGATLGAVSIGVDRLARRIGHVRRS